MTTAAPANLDEPPPDAPRFLRAFWKLVRWALPVTFRYFGTYEYRIATAYAGPVLDLQATEDTIAIGLDDIPKVPAWPGVAGASSSATVGARVLVQFINGNGARPIVVAWAPSGDSGWTATGISFDVGEPLGTPPVPVVSGKLTLGGAAALPLVVAATPSWFAESQAAISALAGYVNGIAPGTVTVPAAPPPTVADKAQASHV